MSATKGEDDEGTISNDGRWGCDSFSSTPCGAARADVDVSVGLIVTVVVALSAQPADAFVKGVQLAVVTRPPEPIQTDNHYDLHYWWACGLNGHPRHFEMQGYGLTCGSACHERDWFAIQVKLLTGRDDGIQDREMYGRIQNPALGRPDVKLVFDGRTGKQELFSARDGYSVGESREAQVTGVNGWLRHVQFKREEDSSTTKRFRAWFWLTK